VNLTSLSTSSVLLSASVRGIPVDSASTRKRVRVNGSGLGCSSENRTRRWSTLATGGSRISEDRWKTFSIHPLRSTQSTEPTRTLSPTMTLRLIFFNSALTTQRSSTPRKLPEEEGGWSLSGTMTRMKFACDAATTPMACDSVSGGLSSRERTGAREENSFNVFFAFRRLRLGAACLLGFCCCRAAIGSDRKRRRRRGTAEATARCRSIENDDANDIEMERNKRIYQCSYWVSVESEVVLCYRVLVTVLSSQCYRLCSRGNGERGRSSASPFWALFISKRRLKTTLTRQNDGTSSAIF